MKEIELLSLGLNFGLTSKRFLLVKYIVATEKLCLSLQEEKAENSIEKEQKRRAWQWIIFGKLKDDHLRQSYER